MGWFTKEKSFSEAACGSGALTCDGKHHKWSRWERKTVDYALRNNKTGEFYNATASIQERTCVACGLTEQKNLGGRDL